MGSVSTCRYRLDDDLLFQLSGSRSDVTNRLRKTQGREIGSGAEPSSVLDLRPEDVGDESAGLLRKRRDSVELASRLGTLLFYTA